MNLRPLGSQILCERLPAQDLSPAGIALIDRSPTSQARVVSVGPKVEGVHPGDTIVFTTSQYEIATFNEREVIFVNFDNCIAVFKS